MNGDQIRDTLFWPSRPGIAGYDAREIDDLVRRVAAELDADRPIRPLIENATFQKRRWRGRYDIDAVDWFLDQVLLAPVGFELAGIRRDPWRQLAVAQLAPGAVSGRAKSYPDLKPRRQTREYFAWQCGNAWRDFGQLPGRRLWWGEVAPGVSELRTEARLTMASLYGGSPARLQPMRVSAGGKSFGFRKPHPMQFMSPDIAEIAARDRRDYAGHFSVREGTKNLVRELADDTGKPVLYASGENSYHRACAGISFPDGRWFRFWVRGTRLVNAIMTAVDQAGNRVAGYRAFENGSIQITVHPDWELTDELVLVFVISAPWLTLYFKQPQGSGGGG